MTPAELVALLDDLFSRFDEIAARHGLEKIKTIGDAYMVVGGVPSQQSDHAKAVVAFGLELISSVEVFARERGISLGVRVGAHSGPVVAGVIGRSKLAYDLWGDTVNVASRMESSGVPGRLHVTSDTWGDVQESFHGTERGEIEVKGKGRMRTWFVDAPHS